MRDQINACIAQLEKTKADLKKIHDELYSEDGDEEYVVIAAEKINESISYLMSLFAQETHNTPKG